MGKHEDLKKKEKPPVTFFVDDEKEVAASVEVITKAFKDHGERRTMYTLVDNRETEFLDYMFIAGTLSEKNGKIDSEIWMNDAGVSRVFQDYLSAEDAMHILWDYVEEGELPDMSTWLEITDEV